MKCPSAIHPSQMHRRDNCRELPGSLNTFEIPKFLLGVLLSFRLPPKPNQRLWIVWTLWLLSLKKCFVLLRINKAFTFYRSTKLLGDYDQLTYSQKKKKIEGRIVAKYLQRNTYWQLSAGWFGFLFMASARLLPSGLVGMMSISAWTYDGPGRGTTWSGYRGSYYATHQAFESEYVQIGSRDRERQLTTREPVPIGGKSPIAYSTVSIGNAATS